jgi:predicted HicB family RNase H-like nuclease
MHNALHLSIEKSYSALTAVGAFGSIASEPVDPMDKKETLNFRVSAEFKRRLTEEAGRERRSLTNYLETTLTRLWDERELSRARKREPKKT